jgi:hypothetical protein
MFPFFAVNMVSAQEKLRRANKAKNARKGDENTNIVPPPIAEKRVSESTSADTRPPKAQKTATGGAGGSARSSPHFLPDAGAPAGRFVVLPVFTHGNLFDKNTEVVIDEADQAIIHDKGPVALKAELATATIAAFKLIEIANFLNGRESRYLSDRDKQKKRADVLGLKLGETEAAYEDYRNSN